MNKEKNIYQQVKTETRDTDVPNYVAHPETLHIPEYRGPSETFVGKEARLRLWQSAVERSVFAASGVGKRPFVHFPNAEHVQHFSYSSEAWRSFGDMESEYSRLMYMLTHHPERHFPAHFFHPRDSGANPNILKQWKRGEGTRREKASKYYQQGVQAMNANKTTDYSNGYSGAYLTLPEYYPTNGLEGKNERRLWIDSCDQLSDTLDQGKIQGIQSFLSLYATIKDPITPLVTSQEFQAEVFLSLKEAAELYVKDTQIKNWDHRSFLTQLALESSFLALPEARNVEAVIHESPHELPYIFIDILQLPRGEFANPSRVGEVSKEIIADFALYQEPVLTPITVSYMEKPFADPELFIVDGNNRVTALLLMHYLYESSFDYHNNAAIHTFIISHGLDIEWERDLVKTLDALSPEDKQFFRDREHEVIHLANTHIPALLVQEPNFHTIAVSLSSPGRIVLLQPWHQVAYNQREAPFAIPSKQQSHGRAAGNNVRISLKPKL